ncbi:hypothetical protein GQ53DRAFT_744439, partial [Thozetella sp. PMI_491]
MHSSPRVLCIVQLFALVPCTSSPGKAPAVSNDATGLSHSGQQVGSPLSSALTAYSDSTLDPKSQSCKPVPD